MKKLVLFTALLCITQTPAHAFNAMHFFIEKQIQRKAQEKFKRLQPWSLEAQEILSDKEGVYKQKIDHTNISDARTFNQRYFINTQFAKAEDSPVIYVICGEGTCDGASTMPAVNAVAKKLGASLVALEHRYYGTSQPFSTMTAENLKYLSTGQAIEDLAEFQRFAKASFNLKGKWVAVGGSYPGNLAAFYRLKHPELVSGALASSAPVLAKADFFEYDRHVAKVAGPTCLAAIKAGVSEVEEMLKDPVQTKEVKALFDSSEVRDNVDFLYILADMAAIAIQYGYQKQFCDALTKGLKNGIVVQEYAKVGLKLFANFGITPVQDSFQGAESLDPNDYLGWAGMRAWMYQSCTEYGYYQVSNPNIAESSRSAKLSLDYHHSVCKRLFGLNKPVDDQATNAHYFKQLFNKSVTNIFFTNGSNDPWSNLSLTTENSTTNRGLTVMTIDGAAHCDDLGSRSSASLTQAREKFSELAGKWVLEKRKKRHVRLARLATK